MEVVVMVWVWFEGAGGTVIRVTYGEVNLEMSHVESVVVYEIGVSSLSASYVCGGKATH
jgi:hypothetical protein